MTPKGLDNVNAPFDIMNKMDPKFLPKENVNHSNIMHGTGNY
jgi:hypothetical protein